MTIDAKENGKTIILVEGNIRVYLHDLRVGKGFFSKTYKKFTENF